MRRYRFIEMIATGTLIFAAVAASATETITYTYDAKGRVILVVHAGSVNNNLVANYAFDPADNRKNIKVTGAP